MSVGQEIKSILNAVGINTKPNEGESHNDYVSRLLDGVNAAKHFVNVTEGRVSEGSMIQLFSLSLINFINSKLENEEVFLACSNDSQNAIAFSHEHGNIFYTVEAELSSNRYHLNSIYLDTDYNLEFDETTNYSTLLEVTETILSQISSLRGK